MAFKIFTATNIYELEAQLNAWEAGTAGLNVVQMQYSCIGAPVADMMVVLPGKSAERHTIIIIYTITPE